MIKLGQNNISAMYLGGAEVRKIYLGETQVYSNSPILCSNQIRYKSVDGNAITFGFSGATDLVSDEFQADGYRIATYENNINTLLNFAERETNLKEIDLSGLFITNYNTKKSFTSCSNLEKITMPTSMNGVTWLSQNELGGSWDSIFRYCSKLESVKFPDDMINVQWAKGAFESCSSITRVEIASLSNLINGNNMFLKCSSLTDLVIGELPKRNITSWALSNCPLSRTSLVGLIASLPKLSQGESYTFTVGSDNLEKLTAEEIAIGTNKGWTIN